jgi:hypothetical protein
MKKLLIILLTAVSFYATALPDSAKQDMYLLGLSDALKEKDYKDALIYIEKLDYLNVEMPNVVNYYRGEALFHTKKYIDANTYLTQYIETSGVKGKHYKSALQLLLKLESTMRKVQKENEKYIIHNDGTVTDSKTGLMWMRCSLGQTWNGTTCVGEAKKYDWYTASELMVKFAGYSDWRLPTIQELYDLTYCPIGRRELTLNWRGNHDICDEYYNFYINQKVFPNTPSDSFWSSTKQGDEKWYLNFDYGAYGYRAILYKGKLTEDHIRLVRGGQ